MAGNDNELIEELMEASMETIEHPSIFARLRAAQARLNIRAELSRLRKKEMELMRILAQQGENETTK